MKKNVVKPDNFILLILIIGFTLLLFYLSIIFSYLITRQVKRNMQEQSQLLVRSIEDTMVAELPARARESLRLFNPPDSSAVIFRPDGNEAFRDNTTIDRINRNLGLKRFLQAPVSTQGIISPEKKHFENTMETSGGYLFFQSLSGEGFSLTLYTPVKNGKNCLVCHGSEKKNLGVLAVSTNTTSLELNKWKVILILFLIFLLIIIIVKIRINRQTKKEILLLKKTSADKEPSIAHPILSRELRIFSIIALKGFTSFAEKQSPDQVLKTYLRIENLIESVVSRHNGALYNAGEDKLMVIYQGEFPELAACRALLAIRTELKNSLINEGLRTGASLHEGTVLIDGEGRILPGADLKLALKLANTASGDQIIITGKVCRKIDQQIRKKGPFKIKGQTGDYEDRVFFLEEIVEAK